MTNGNIKTANLGEYEINWGFDGADEVDPNKRLIKGLGGALYKEKKNIKQTPIVYILVDKLIAVKESPPKEYIESVILILSTFNRFSNVVVINLSISILR